MNESREKLVLTKNLYKEIFTEYYKPMCLFVKKLVFKGEEAEDIVHNVFLTVWEKQPEFNSKEHLKAFLFRSAYNQAITHINHQLFVQRAWGDFQWTQEEQENYLKKRIETEVFCEMMQAVEQLPERCRQVFKLSYIEGLKVSEVAQRLHISEDTVKTQRLRARKHLQFALKDLFSLAVLLYL